MNLERLESRQLFSVTAYQTGDYLYVNGDGANDFVVVDGSLTEISVNTDSPTQPFTGVKLVIVSLGDGADTLEFHLQSASLIAKGGAGDDVLLGSVDNGYDVAIDGGSGNNFIEFSGDSTPGGLAIIIGGSSTDTINVSAFDNVIINSGSGDDIIFVSGSKGLMINAGSGIDTINVENATGNSVILGGSGNDGITISGTGNFVVLGGAGADGITNNAVGNVVWIS